MNNLQKEGNKVIQKMKNGKVYEFESVAEREERLEATAGAMFIICKSSSLTISDYKRTIEILNTMVEQNTIISDQLNA